MHMSSLESGSEALRGGGECDVLDQTEGWRCVHRNGHWERVSVCWIEEARSTVWKIPSIKGTEKV